MSGAPSSLAHALPPLPADGDGGTETSNKSTKASSFNVSSPSSSADTFPASELVVSVIIVYIIDSSGHSKKLTLFPLFGAHLVSPLFTETHSLITHLTTADQQVASFSSDGKSFNVYDQAAFAQKYLPQYFKHSNWGSFVRQLNLYGFTSSRLKENNDVVVWSHSCFHRDRTELIPQIKRPKKTKTASSTRADHVPRSPRIDGHTSEGGSSSPHSHGEEEHYHSSDGYRMASTDQQWLQSEFATLKQQNSFLEQKLDMLINLTLKQQPPQSEEERHQQRGLKRRRTSAFNASETRSSADLFAPNPIHRLSARSFNSGESRAEGSAGGSDKDDSFKSFIDVMLADGTENGECKTMDDYSQAGSSQGGYHYQRYPHVAYSGDTNRVYLNPQAYYPNHNHASQHEVFPMPPQDQYQGG
eukprot:scaffold8197_cov175-Alexandrium_tamarense.AAC.7